MNQESSQGEIKKTMRWLFDTNSIIKMGKPENRDIFEYLKSTKKMNFISKITILEYPKSPKIYEIFNIIDVNQQITDIALRIILNLRKKGDLIPIADVLIMASAEYHKIPLIITDDAHFHLMKQYAIYSKKILSLHDFQRRIQVKYTI